MSDGTVQRWDAYVQTEGAEPHVDWIEDADGGVVTYDDHKAIVDALRTQAAQPVWGKEKPTVAGQYWFKEPSVAPYVVQVGSDGLGLWVWWECKWQSLDDWNGEWAGPIPLPREA